MMNIFGFCGKKLVILFVFFLPATIQAQDIIFRKDGTIQKVKIVDIDTNGVFYKKLGSQYGSTLVASWQNIDSAQYADGRIAVLATNGRISLHEPAFIPMMENNAQVENKQGTYIVTASKLNVRAAASSESSIIGGFAKGDTALVLSFKNNWAEINFKNRTGYISSKYIQKIQVDDVPVNNSVSNEKPFTIQDSQSLEPILQDNKQPSSFGRFRLIRYTSTLALGLSNFYSSQAYSNPRFGLCVDGGVQFAMDIKPIHWLLETTFGFDLLGNSNYPFYSLSINILPIGCQSNTMRLGKSANAKYYFVGGVSLQMPFGDGIYFYNNEKHYSFSPSINLNLVVKGGLELTDKVAIGIMYLHGITNVCHDLPIDVKNSTILIYGSFMLNNKRQK